jgi:hypothetical protein
VKIAGDVTMKLTRDQKIAFAEFLESEKSRHLEDIAMINKKLGLLAEQGIVAGRIAPWVEDTDITYEDLGPDIPEECIEYLCGEGHRLKCDHGNQSPFGGYWRYQLDKAFDNSTGEDNDGFPGEN